MRIALYEPEIPQNTGTILRMAACLDIGVDIIEPCGFALSDRRMKRSGMDYLDTVDLQRHINWATFWDKYDPKKIVLLTPNAPQTHLDFSFKPDQILLLGKESTGVPEIVENEIEKHVKIPMQKNVRSLNVAISAAIVLGESLRQNNLFPRG